MILRGISQRAVFSQLKMSKVDLLAGDQVLAGLNCLLPGQAHALHVHVGQDKLYLVLEGCGDVTVGQRTERIGRGDLVLAREDEPHALHNPGPEKLVVLAIMAPPPGPKPKPAN